MRAGVVRASHAVVRALALVATVTTAGMTAPTLAVSQTAPTSARETLPGRSLRGALAALDAAARERQARRDGARYDPIFQ